MGQEQVRVLVTDRNPLVLDALADLIRDIDSNAAISTASSLPTALMRARSDQSQLVLLDVSLSAHIEHAIHDLHVSSPRAAVYVTSFRVDAEFQTRVLRAGGMGCCDKLALPSRAFELLGSVKKIIPLTRRDLGLLGSAGVPR